jgi:hypothetical protein
MESKTYTKRTNARRAVVQSGIPSALVKITVHKIGDTVRFGWARVQADHMPPAAAVKLKKVAPDCEVRNGIKRPAFGGVCRAVWDWLDMNPGVTNKEAKAIAGERMWNPNNVACEYYAWRKFHGIAGRVDSR